MPPEPRRSRRLEGLVMKRSYLLLPLLHLGRFQQLLWQRQADGDGGFCRARGRGGIAEEGGSRQRARRFGWTQVDLNGELS